MSGGAKSNIARCAATRAASGQGGVRPMAFTICSTADDLSEETQQSVLRFAASGFRDFTRIAASDPTMWRDVFLNNREALLEMLARFTEDAHAMGRAVRRGEAAFIEDSIRRGRRIRRGLIEIKQA